MAAAVYSSLLLVFLLVPSLEGMPQKRSLSCPTDTTEISGPSEYTDTTTCGDIISAGANLNKPIYLSECARQLGSTAPYILRDAFVIQCLTFANGTIRHRSRLCCPDVLTEKRCFTCQNEEILMDELTYVYETDHCNMQELHTCSDDEHCATRHDYFAALGGGTRYEVTKGCQPKKECNAARDENSVRCVDNVVDPSCTYCCSDPLCNEDKTLRMLNAFSNSSVDDPCNLLNGQENPCLNEGVCVPDESVFTCECSNGYHGDLCEYDACTAPNPCGQDNTCLNISSSPYYKCYCRANFYGDDCTQEYPQCSINRCLNGGTCFVQGLRDRCVCPPNVLGEYCEIEPNLPNECVSPDLYLKVDTNLQDVLSNTSRQSCTTKYNYIRNYWLSKDWLVQKCRSRLFPDFQDGLDGNIKLMDLHGIGMYQCEQGDTSLFYNVDVCCPSCLSKPCQNGGWCIQDGANHVCRCRYGFSGDQCQYKTKHCVVFGDPHYLTFDKSELTFQGACKYCLVSVTNASMTDLPEFYVYGKNENRDNNTAISWPAYVEVVVYGVTIRIGKDRYVTVDGVSIGNSFDLKTYAGRRLVLQINGAFVQLDAEFGLRVQFDGQTLIEIWLPDGLSEQTGCMCGNSNGNPGDDLLTSAGLDVTGDPASFAKIGNSWRVDDEEDLTCEDTEPENPVVCTPTDFPFLDDNDYCGLITNPIDSPFAACFSQNPGFIDMFGDACYYDVCANNGSKGSACASLIALDRICADLGFTVEWRTQDICPMECHGGREYVRYGPACPVSCTRPRAAELCSLQDTESCACPSDQVVKDDQCVDPTECGCVDDQGNNYQIGFSWKSDDCKKVYTCEFCDDCDDGFGQIVEVETECPTDKPRCINGTCYPNLPCTENPGACNTGECIDQLSHPNGYICDCTDTGMTGEHCENPGGSLCGAFHAVYCKVCTGAASEAECDSFGTPTICEQTDAVCELTVNYGSQDEIVSVSRSCIAHADCANQYLGDEDCNGYSGKRSVAARSASRSCTTCVAGSCLEKPECADDSLYCYSCHSHSEAGCWVAGTYEQCDPESMCFYRNTTNSAGRDVFERGCTKLDQCLNPSPGLSCGLGAADPTAPERPLYSCSKPSVGSCFCKGDPHCMTFDGVYIPQVPGSCMTTFARDNCVAGQPRITGTPSFVVTINPDYLTNQKVAVQAVHIKATIGGTTTTIAFGQNVGLVSINDGAPQSIGNDPLEVSGHSIEMVSAKVVRVELSNGVSVDWNFKKEVSTHVPHIMMETTCGICGDFDGTPTGDYEGGPSNSGVCPNESNVSLGPGEAVTEGKEEDFALSWVSGIDNTEARCCESCGLDADQCQ